MSNDLTVAPLFPQGVVISQRALAFLKQRPEVADELSAGITGGFAVLGIKGKTWTIKHRGENTPILAPAQPGMPPQAVPHLAVTIIAASDKLTKTWYENGYVEGSTEAPDCYSMNGEAPDPLSKKRQNTVCSTCKWNQFGSRVSPDGKSRGKACTDSKRLAIVPSDDMKNEINGGAMLMRVPPASLAGLQEYASKLRASSAVFFAVSTWVYFDPNEAYPKIMFTPHRPLTDDEFEFVLSMRDNDATVKRIIESSEAITAPNVGDEPQAGAVPQPMQQAPQPVPQPVPQPAPAPASAAPTPEPVPEPAPVPEAMQAATVPAAPVETQEEREAREFAEFKASRAAAQNAAASAPQPANTNPDPAPAPAPTVQAAPPPVTQAAPPVAQAAPTQASAPPQVQTTAPTPAPAGEAATAPQGAPAFTNFLNDLMG